VIAALKMIGGSLLFAGCIVVLGIGCFIVAPALLGVP
jgi:hypothetical protein